MSRWMSARDTEGPKDPTPLGTLETLDSPGWWPPPPFYAATPRHTQRTLARLAPHARASPWRREPGEGTAAGGTPPPFRTVPGVLKQLLNSRAPARPPRPLGRPPCRGRPP